MRKSAFAGFATLLALRRLPEKARYMCPVPGAGMTRIRFEECFSVPFAHVPWRVLLTIAGTGMRIPAHHRKVRVARTRRTLATGGTPLGTKKILPQFTGFRKKNRRRRVITNCDNIAWGRRIMRVQRN